MCHVDLNYCQKRTLLLIVSEAGWGEPLLHIFLKRKNVYRMAKQLHSVSAKSHFAPLCLL
jgi:hypothetical protein